MIVPEGQRRPTSQIRPVSCSGGHARADTGSSGLSRLSESVFELGGAGHTDGMASSSVVDDPVADGELGGCFGWPKVPYLCAVASAESTPRSFGSRLILGMAVVMSVHTKQPHGDWQPLTCVKL
jgi:hypothetical protein